MKKLIALATLVLATGLANAQVTGTVSYVMPDTGSPGGSFQYLATPPSTVGNNNINTSDTVFAFAEQSKAFGNAPGVNVGGPIASTTLVSSYYVYFDPRNSQRIKATLTFADVILGVYTRTGTTDVGSLSGAGLKGSQDNFGLSGVNYQYVSATGLEASDRAISHFSISGNTLTLDWTASNPGDHIRVLTAVSAVPEPETYAMLLAGLGLIGAVARRRKAKHA